MWERTVGDAALGEDGKVIGEAEKDGRRASSMTGQVNSLFDGWMISTTAQIWVDLSNRPDY